VQNAVAEAANAPGGATHVAAVTGSVFDSVDPELFSAEIV
jgi:hypothetical protein